MSKTVGQPKHQKMLDELIEKISKYERAKSRRKAVEDEYFEYINALKEEQTIKEQLQILQKELHSAGIDYKMPIEETQSPLAETKLTKDHIRKTKTPSKSEITETFPKLTYELVMRTADEIMGSGRAVSSGSLIKKLNLDKRGQNIVKEHLRNAVKEGKYETREESQYAFKGRFSVFYPRGKDLPFLPPFVSTAEYTILVEKAKSAIEKIGKDEFTQQEFYKILRPLAEQENIAPKKTMLTIPSVLGNYVKEGILETEDRNTYTKKTREIHKPAQEPITETYVESIESPETFGLDELDQKILSNMLACGGKVKSKKEFSQITKIRQDKLEDSIKKLNDLGYVSSNNEHSVTKLYFDEEIKRHLGIGLLPKIQELMFEISTFGSASMLDTPIEICNSTLAYIKNDIKLVKQEGDLLKLTPLGKTYASLL